MQYDIEHLKCAKKLRDQKQQEAKLSLR